MYTAPRRIRVASYVSCVVWWGLTAILLVGGLSGDGAKKPPLQDLGPALLLLWVGGWAYAMRAALNRRLVTLDRNELWAATLAGPRRVNIEEIRQVDARLLIGKGSDLSIMILKDADGRRLWLTQRMFGPQLDAVERQIDAHTATVTQRAAHIFGLGPPVPREKRIVLGAVTCAWYIGSMAGLAEALAALQNHVAF